MSWAEETKLYGVISYLSADGLELRINDLRVGLEQAEVEGFLSLGALVEVEGDWRGDTFIANEVEVKRAIQPNLTIYRGQVVNGKLLGLEFPDLPEGQWLELSVRRTNDATQILLLRPLEALHSAVQGSVEALTEDGFIAGGVRVVSSHEVELGAQISVEGEWQADRLVLAD